MSDTPEKTPPTYQPRGRYFEEFEVGQQIASQGRTVTEADIVNFAGLSGDFNTIHTDAAFAAEQPFGKRVAHGLLIQSIASGLAVQTGIIEGTVLAFREIEAKFSLPVFIGDTIHVILTIEKVKYFRRLKAGNVYIKVDVVNQDGEVVQRGLWTMLVQSNKS